MTYYKINIKHPNPLYMIIDAIDIIEIKNGKKMQKLYKQLQTYIPNGNKGI